MLNGCNDLFCGLKNKGVYLSTIPLRSLVGVRREIQYQYSILEKKPIFGGNWNDGVGAGSFAQNLNNHRTNSNVNNGSRLDISEFISFRLPQ